MVHHKHGHYTEPWGSAILSCASEPKINLKKYSYRKSGAGIAQSV
jgi:hypothetical protein